LASVKIIDLLLQSYNRKLGRKIGRFTIKSEALAALVSGSQCVVVYMNSLSIMSLLWAACHDNEFNEQRIYGAPAITLHRVVSNARW